MTNQCKSYITEKQHDNGQIHVMIILIAIQAEIYFWEYKFFNNITALVSRPLVPPLWDDYTPLTQDLPQRLCCRLAMLLPTFGSNIER